MQIIFKMETDTQEHISFFSGLTRISKVFILLLIFIFLAGVFIFLIEEDENVDTNNETSFDLLYNQESNELSNRLSDLIIIPDQASGGFVLIEEMNLAESRWVVIHENNEGELGNILGASLFSIDEENGRINLLRETIADNLYHAVLYTVGQREEDQNRIFDITIDQPMTEDGGVIKKTTFETF